MLAKQRQAFAKGTLPARTRMSRPAAAGSRARAVAVRNEIRCVLCGRRRATAGDWRRPYSGCGRSQRAAHWEHW
jgi:hypothetical protein